MKFSLGASGAFQGEFEYGTLNISSDTEIGFRPVDLLVSSLAGCSGGLLKIILEKKRIAFDNIQIEADIVRGEKKVQRVTKVALHYTVFGKDLNLEQVQRSLKLAAKNCPMVKSVEGSIEVVETIEVREA